MKKLIYSSLFLASVGIAVVACKKESTQATKNENLVFDNSLNIASDGKTLIFKTVADYEKVISSTSREVRKEFLEKVSKMKHITYAEKMKMEKSNKGRLLIADGFLEEILNSDRIVQIGNYLYQVNTAEEMVYVLPATKMDEYDDLVTQNTKNKNILKFSTDESVIALVENGGDDLFCKEDCAGSQSASTNYIATTIFGNDNVGIQGYVKYVKIGIYFYMHAHADRLLNNNTARIYIEGENVFYHVKCGTTVGGYSFPWHQSNSSTANNQNYYTNAQAKCFNGFHFKMRVRCEIDGHPQGNNSYTTFFTNWAEIEANSPY